jgi:WD40 repeat protein
MFLRTNCVRHWLRLSPAGIPRLLRSVAFSPDGQQVATGSDDGTAILWDVRTSEMAHQPLTGHTDSVTGVAFSADGRLLVTASNDRSLRLWDAHSGKALGQALTGGHVDSVRCVAISPDGRRIVSGGWDNTLVLWDVATRRVLARRPDAHAKVIRSVAFSADGALIVSSSDDRSVRLWTGTRRARRRILRGHKLPVRGAVFSREDANPRDFGQSGRQPADLESAPQFGSGNRAGRARRRVRQRCTSPDRNVVASGADLRLHLWTSGPGGGTTRILPGKPARIVSLAYAADGSRVVGGDWDGRLYQWDGRTGEPVGEAIDIFEKSPTADGKPVEPSEKPISALAYSPDGKRIASGGWDKKLRIWDAQSGAALTPRSPATAAGSPLWPSAPTAGC